MRIASVRIFQSLYGLVLTGCLAIMSLLFHSPSAAGNRFTTIGGGVSGSSDLKTDDLRLILFVVAGIMMLGTLLNIFMSHKNPLYVNASLWKPSAIIMFVLSMLALVSAVLL